tara:strand:- start:2929 stop:4020 length:1092 start_codon:yes stop_codon:yes gene_type:complete
MNAIHSLTLHCDVLIITGGLGPTSDDCTRESLADAIGQPLIEHDDAKRHLIEFYEHRKRVMPEINNRQIKVPETATLIPNDIGTALGFWVTHSNCLIICLPGVPFEMHPMFLEHGLPLIENHLGVSKKIMKQRTFKCFGIGESNLAELIEQLKLPKPVVVLYRTQFPEVHISLSVSSHAMNELDWEQILEKVQKKIHPFLFSQTNESLMSVVGQWCHQRGHRLALVESCTGGRLGGMLTEVSGASDWFEGGVVAYQNAIKKLACGVPESLIQAHGAVSESCAAAMAAGILKHWPFASIAIAITGVAGPNGGSKKTPVGTVCCGVATRHNSKTITWHFHGDRNRIQLLACYSACVWMMKFDNVD